VSFSVDPTFDTPEVLAAYARTHHAVSERWHFLTGDQSAMQKTVELGLKTAMEKTGEKDGVPAINHGSHFVLVDQAGQIRGVYDMNDADAVARVVRDAGRLAIEEPLPQR
jgi:protein SCO1/2